jgi:hypothetical protein
MTGMHFAAVLAMACTTTASPLPLFGYFCPTCPGDVSPSAILASMPPIYTHVAIAFAGWDASGNVLNQWDAAWRGGFIVNASVVGGLKARGVRVFLSVGGGAANVLPGEVSLGPVFKSCLFVHAIGASVEQL